MSWPYTPRQCPQCYFFERYEMPVLNDAGYEIVGLCLNQRIGMELFCFQQLDPDEMESCPGFLDEAMVRRRQ